MTNDIQPATDAMMAVTDLCNHLGIELRGDDGQPYHCGERMRVKAGILGPDYAACNCGLAVGNAASPHISGCIHSEAWFAEHGNRTWIQLSAPKSKQETP